MRVERVRGEKMIAFTHNCSGTQRCSDGPVSRSNRSRFQQQNLCYWGGTIKDQSAAETCNDFLYVQHVLEVIQKDPNEKKVVFSDFFFWIKT